MKKYHYFIFFVPFILFSQSKLKVGDVAPKINITDYIANVPDNKNLENKYILLEFWATWCGPCLQEVPHLNSLQEKFKDKKDLIFVSITEEKPDKILRTLKRIPFNSMVVSDQSGDTFTNFIKDKQGSYNIPVTILIDNKGIIKLIGHPRDLNDKLFENFLNNKTVDIQDKKLSSDIVPTPMFNAPSEETILDIVYKTINNNATKYCFTLLEGSKEVNSYISNNLQEEGLYFDLNNKLINILSDFSNTLESNIQLPETFANKYYGVFYKNLIEKDKIKLEKDIKIQLLNALQLSEQIVNKDKDVYILTLKDKNKLNIVIDDSKSQTTKNKTHFLFFNTDVNIVVEEISKNFKINVIKKTKLDGKFDFIFKINDIETVSKELELYGLSLVKSRENVATYIYK